MGKVIFSTMMTLDGFMEGPNQSLDWATIDEELHRFVNREVQDCGAILYGRRTYQVMEAYWPTADRDPSISEVELEFAQIWKSKPKIVYSRTLSRLPGNARLERNVIPEEIRKLKEHSDESLALGGANLASTFFQLDLIDEYQLYIHPVVIGQGTQAFWGIRERHPLRLAETYTFNSGVVFIRYHNA